MDNTKYAGSVPLDKVGGYDSLRYFFGKPFVHECHGRLVFSGLPIRMPEIQIGGAAVLVDLTKVRVRIARGVVSGERTRYPTECVRNWQSALERLVAAFIAPECVIEYIDDTWGYGAGRGFFTLSEYGGEGGNHHNFHSRSMTPPEHHALVLDKLYKAGSWYLRAITSPAFMEVVDKVGRMPSCNLLENDDSLDEIALRLPKELHRAIMALVEETAPPAQ